NVITVSARDAAGNTGAVSITVTFASSTASTGTPNGTEPVFNASTQQLIFQDNFDSYASFSDAVATGWRCANGSTNDVTTNAAGACQIIPGMNGTGKAIRLVFDGVANAGPNEGHSWSRAIADNLAGMPGHAFYISYYTRITSGGGYTLDT